MSTTFERIQHLVANGDVLISRHGYNELAQDGISVQEVVEGLYEAILVEDYPEYYKGPCVLVLQYDKKGCPIHVVWGIPRGKDSPAVLVTAYRPDPEKWDKTFRRRKK